MLCRVLLVIFSGSVMFFAQGHGWQELATPDLARQHIEQLLVVVEEQQANVPSMTRFEGQGYAKDWLEHFSNTIGLDTFTGQADFSAIIADLYPNEEEIFLNWQHDMQYIVHVYDASMFSVDEQTILSELASLDLSQEIANEFSYHRAEELSYQLGFVGIPETDKVLIAPFIPRITQLIEAVQGAQ